MSEVFDGTVEVQDGGASTTVLLDGTQGDAHVGGGGQGRGGERIEGGSDGHRARLPIPGPAFRTAQVGGSRARQ